MMAFANNANGFNLLKMLKSCYVFENGREAKHLN